MVNAQANNLPALVQALLCTRPRTPARRGRNKTIMACTRYANADGSMSALGAEIHYRSVVVLPQHPFDGARDRAVARELLSNEAIQKAMDGQSVRHGARPGASSEAIMREHTSNFINLNARGVATRRNRAICGTDILTTVFTLRRARVTRPDLLTAPLFGESFAASPAAH